MLIKRIFSKGNLVLIERFEFADNFFVELKMFSDKYWVTFSLGNEAKMLEFDFIDQAGAFYEHIVNSVIKKRKIKKPQGIFKNGN